MAPAAFHAEGSDLEPRTGAARDRSRTKRSHAKRTIPALSTTCLAEWPSDLKAPGVAPGATFATEPLTRFGLA